MIFMECTIFVLIGVMVGILFGAKTGYAKGYDAGIKEGFSEGWESYENENTVVVRTDAPEKLTKRNIVSKLENSLDKYIEKTTDNKLIIRVVKNNNYSEEDEN